MNLKLQASRQRSGHVTSRGSRFAGNADNLDLNLSNVFPRHHSMTNLVNKLEVLLFILENMSCACLLKINSQTYLNEF